MGRRLARFGVTGVTDATPDNDRSALDAFARAVSSGQLPQKLVVMGTPGLPPPRAPGLERGAVKILLRERALPRFDVGRYREIAGFERVQSDLRREGRRLYFAGDYLMDPSLEGAIASAHRAAAAVAADLSAG